MDFNTLLNLRSGVNFKLKGRELNLLTTEKTYTKDFFIDEKLNLFLKIFDLDLVKNGQYRRLFFQKYQDLFKHKLANLKYIYRDGILFKLLTEFTVCIQWVLGGPPLS